jgi:hypothetical protein
MYLWHHDERCHNVPSPLVGEGQGGGWRQIRNSTITPLPTPPPQGGREQTEFAATPMLHCKIDDRPQPPAQHATPEAA